MEYLKQIDWKKVGKGLAIALIGALLTYLAQFLSGTDFGEWTPLAVAVASALTNLAKIAAKL